MASAKLLRAPLTRLPDTVSEIVNDEVEFDEESFNTYFGALFLRRDQVMWGANGESISWR